MFTVQVDLTQYHSLVGRTLSVMGGLCEVVADLGAKDVVDHAREHGKFKDRTGGLRRDIRIGEQARFDGVQALATVSALKAYAVYVEYGTEAHWIRPRVAYGFIGPTNVGQTRAGWEKVPGRLHFFSEKLGRWVHPIEVWHPGTDGRFFMSLASRHAYYSMIRRWPVAALRLGRIWN